MTGRDTRDRSRCDPMVTRLYAERIVLGITRRQMAERSGLTSITIASLETGKRGASVATLRAYARGLGYEPTLIPIPEEES